MKLPVKIKLLNKEAVIPQYAHDGDSGVDLAAMKEYTLNPGEVALIDTGIAIQFEKGYEAQVRPRSGMASKRRLSVINTPGTIDSTYNGEVKVALINLGQHTQRVNKGERIAQMVFVPIMQADFTLVDQFEETTRGDGGFGSTGTN